MSLSSQLCNALNNFNIDVLSRCYCFHVPRVYASLRTIAIPPCTARQQVRSHVTVNLKKKRISAVAPRNSRRRRHATQIRKNRIQNCATYAELWAQKRVGHMRKTNRAYAQITELFRVCGKIPLLTN